MKIHDPGEQIEHKYECPSCKGKGHYYEEGNLHESGGIVPCSTCHKLGYITMEEKNRIYKKRVDTAKIFKGFDKN